MEDWEKDGQRQRVRQRAFRRLAEMHPEDFDRLHAEERRKEKMPPVGAGGPTARRPDLSTPAMVADYRSGMTSRAIAAKYSCSTQAVLARLHKAGIKMRQRGHKGWAPGSL